jgi:hypothetical protein
MLQAPAAQHSIQSVNEPVFAVVLHVVSSYGRVPAQHPAAACPCSWSDVMRCCSLSLRLCCSTASGGALLTKRFLVQPHGRGTMAATWSPHHMAQWAVIYTGDE